MNLNMFIKLFFNKILRPNGKINFLASLPKEVHIFDVGCGNNSPYRTKSLLPNCLYTGIDVGDYNQTKINQADYYILCSENEFATKISQFFEKFDAVISSHNIEHCNHRSEVLKAMLNSLKPGGSIYLSFPCEQSIYFPNRGGTLNYFDDPTHKFDPPGFEKTKKSIEDAGFSIVYANRQYKPKLLFCIGFIVEPLARLVKKNMIGTWEYYGFESIIIAKKIAK